MKNTHYELTFIIDGNIPETEHGSIAKNIKDLILKHGANIISEVELGRKKLNYLIKKSLKGSYFSLEFNIEPNKIKPIENEMKLEGKILRFLIIKKPENAINKASDKEKMESRDISSDRDDKRIEKKPRRDFKSEKTEEAKIEAPKQEEKPKEEIKEAKIEEVVEKEDVKEVEVEDTPKVEEKIEETEKVEKNELDEKLDAILNKEEF